MASTLASPPNEPQRLTITHWLILIVATIGFAFDTYVLLMTPLIARPALAQLLPADPYTVTGYRDIVKWTGWIMWGTAIAGGVFGLLGGYLTDRFGRRRVLTWSILLYAGSALAAAFSTSAWMLLLLRCATFIGVCVEFVAAVAWLAELFPHPHQRETVLGYTQAFSSLGGLMVTGVWVLVNSGLAKHLPTILGDHAPWRYALVSGVIPALPLIVIRPFLPESPAWQIKRAQGTLKRPSIAELFQPGLARTSLVTAALFACGFGAAFGALQWTPQMVPGLVFSKQEQAEFKGLRQQYERAKDSTDAPRLKERINELQQQQQRVVGRVQLFQEIGGLIGRFALAWLALRILSRRKLLWLFLVPGLIIIPLVYLIPAAGHLPGYNIPVLEAGIFLAGFFTIAQFSYWGNYLPLVYPTHLRGTGESFAANVGGRMIGTAANPLTGFLAAGLFAGLAGTGSLACAAATVAFLVYAIASVLTFWLPEPKAERLLD